MDVDTGNYDVYVNTLIIAQVAVVEGESSEAKVGGTGKTLRDSVITT